MQQPRRTSEFLDETGAASSIRTSRTTLRLQTTPGTAQKYSQRRTALSTRNLSFDRVYGAGSSTSRGTTPSRATSTSSRALFGTTAFGGGALHNDKKWVQEQTQRITEYLRRAVLAGHTNVEFINHTTLRQMTIKQFVSIINHFLQFMAGNRLTVGSNHVEDIVSVLQKLQYPHPINKSWLKTPNTQHSFGNVIVLLSFMLDFVPPPAEDETLDWLFALQEAQDTIAEQSFMGWDPDFQQQMMQHCAEAFVLWDKQLMDDYADMQQQTCNIFIKKRCGLSNATTLERSIEKLKKELDSLQTKCKPIPKELIQRKQQQREECVNLNAYKQKLVEKLHNLQLRKQEFEKKRTEHSEELSQLQLQIQALQAQIKQQVCNIQQRDALMNQLYELKILLKSEERTLQAVQEKNDRQQVEISRNKKLLTEEIEQINVSLREINELVIDMKAASGKCLKAIEDGELQLPLKLECKNLEFFIKLLKTLYQQIVQKLKSTEKGLEDCQKQVEANEVEIKQILQTQYDLSLSKLNMKRSALKKQQTQQQADMQAIVQQRQQLQIQIDELKLKYTELNDENKKIMQNVRNMQQKNETVLIETEEKHKKCMDAHEHFFGRYEVQLNENLEQLTTLNQLLLHNQR